MVEINCILGRNYRSACSFFNISSCISGNFTTLFCYFSVVNQRFVDFSLEISVVVASANIFIVQLKKRTHIISQAGFSFFDQLIFILAGCHIPDHPFVISHQSKLHILHPALHRESHSSVSSFLTCIA